MANTTSEATRQRCRPEDLIELRAGHVAQRLHRLTEGFFRFVRQLWQRFKRQRAGDLEPDERVDFRLLFDKRGCSAYAAIETVTREPQRPNVPVVERGRESPESSERPFFGERNEPRLEAAALT